MVNVLDSESVYTRAIVEVEPTRGSIMPQAQCI